MCYEDISVFHIVYLCSKNKSRQIIKDYTIVVFIHEILILITVIFNKVNMANLLEGSFPRIALALSIEFH